MLNSCQKVRNGQDSTRGKEERSSNSFSSNRKISRFTAWVKMWISPPIRTVAWERLNWWKKRKEKVCRCKTEQRRRRNKKVKGDEKEIQAGEILFVGVIKFRFKRFFSIYFIYLFTFFFTLARVMQNGFASMFTGHLGCHCVGNRRTFVTISQPCSLDFIERDIFFSFIFFHFFIISFIYIIFVLPMRLLFL